MAASGQMLVLTDDQTVATREAIGTMETNALVGLTLVVLIGSALLLRSAQRLQAVDPGFDAREVSTLRILLPKDKDVRLLNVWGYARLVGYDENLELKPDLLSAVEVSEGRIFTLRLRKGHKWSDGAPFTADDVKFTLVLAANLLADAVRDAFDPRLAGSA